MVSNLKALFFFQTEMSSLLALKILLCIKLCIWIRKCFQVQGGSVTAVVATATTSLLHGAVCVIRGLVEEAWHFLKY